MVGASFFNVKSHMRNKTASSRINKISRALDEMRLPGAFLMETHNRNGTSSWHIVSQNGGSQVTDGVANRLLRDPRIQPSGDALFGISQTYRLLPTTWRERADRDRHIANQKPDNKQPGEST